MSKLLGPRLPEGAILDLLSAAVECPKLAVLYALLQVVCRRRGEKDIDWQLPAKGLKFSHSDWTDGPS
ncbi:hypothetical protein Bphyt_6357 [Paraburkholderia phytofirmans PsJN]|uniref:Uncharacterized protein n=1 Tax=Paraburkholderia phytofirmans (strain DSM 17436 / LMG 22146 / PsJN) TaxID=398527 RepID=B2T8L7_PARPJ|nr:hypothetical protein Bphyt_6357 [Paraburkholderia phytofirmans PsJN]